MHKEIKKCRICGNTNLVPLINLGNQCLTGVFPKSKSDKITSGPLELVKCHPKDQNDLVCHLVQLHHSYESAEMYGMNYGYRSGLNKSMVTHLTGIVQNILAGIDLNKGDLIVDIGSNDSTLLQQYPSDKGLLLTGVDPTGPKFKKYYPAHIGLIPYFFSFEKVNAEYPGQKAKVITSIAMFYDLEDPLLFAKQIFQTLADDGIWVFEQSYLPAMLETNSYDTICHEHVEYYALKQIKYMLDEVGFRIIDVDMNDINGGSFRITAAKKQSKHKEKNIVSSCFEAENKMNLDSLKTYEKFSPGIVAHKNKLLETLREIRKSGKKIFGYGASTKGNVILQYCGITPDDIPFIAEVNEDKFGAFTPFTNIPIISEKDAKAMKPDYFLVLPWHFRKNILEREKEFLNSGGKFIFPLPKIEIVNSA